eukprot:jgi/Botrbrau1/745/Bobra.0181s0004.1
MFGVRASGCRSLTISRFQHPSTACNIETSTAFRVCIYGHESTVRRTRRSQCRGVHIFLSKEDDRGVPISHAPKEKPLIVVLGWLGAQERYFQKYVSLWHSQGFQTFGYRPATSSILLPPLGDQRAEAFIRQVREAQDSCPGRPVVYHIFSNAAFIFMGTVLRALSKATPAAPLETVKQPQASSGFISASGPATESIHPLLQPVRGFIFDSCPCRLTPDVSARGFTAAALGEAADGVEERHPWMISMARTAFRPILGSPYISKRLQEVYDAWETTAPICPQLFLYSAADALIPTSEVQRFMRIQEARGARVTSHLWANTKHCEHYRVHPEQYTELLLNFVSGLQAPHESPGAQHSAPAA